MNASPLAITMKGVQMRYPGAQAVSLTIESLTIAQGRRVALIGPNGAGKSTLLKALMGLAPTMGAIQVFGQPVGRERSRSAYVPQRRDVDWQFPIVAQDVALMGRDVHLRWPQRLRASDRALAAAALEEVGMSDCGQRHIAELSGGQQQRVFLARALAQQADLLLLDEPFVGIDTNTEAVIFKVIDRLCTAGKTVVVATHDLATLADHFDLIVLLQHKLIACGAPAAVLQPELLALAYGGPLALFHRPLPEASARTCPIAAPPHGHVSTNHMS